MGGGISHVWMHPVLPSALHSWVVLLSVARGIVNGSGWEEGTENLISAYTLYKILKSCGRCLWSWLWFSFFFFLPRKALTNEAFYDAYKTVLVARFFILSTFSL